MKIKTLVLSLVLMLLSGTTSAADAGNQAQIDQLNSQTESLKRQLADLQQQVNSLKAQDTRPQHKKKTKRYSVNKAAKKGKPGIASPMTQLPSNLPYAYPYVASPDVGEAKGSDMDRLIQTYLTNLPVDWDNPGQSYVSIGPYLNVPIQFNGDNLIINDPKINTDVALLKLRKAAHQGMAERGIHMEDETHHSHLLLSGNLEGQAQYIQHGVQGGIGATSSGNNGSSTNVDFTGTELDAFLMSPSPWISGFFSFSYDTTRNPNDTNSRVLNSRIFLNNAFIILGDFNQSPVYGTLGQIFVPFGTYSSVMVSSPLTKRLARTKARALLAGYQQQSTNALYSAVYMFKGDSHASSTSRINNGGANLGYRFDLGKPDITGDLGVGYIASITDAVGMQYTGNQPLFNGFGGPIPYGNEKIVHRVPALDLRGRFSFGKAFDFVAEYVGVTTSFNPNDLNFNNSAAKPWAINSELAYTFEILCKPTSIGVGYGQAHEALGIGLPERRVSAVINTSIWHNTIQSFEVRHDINYAQSTFATGSTVAPPITGLGTSDNIFTLQFDVYF